MLNVRRMNWDDVRVFLATMRAGSLRQVAVDLEISHPTASRRLSALEKRVGLTLFHRRSSGLEPTPEALELTPAAQEVERAMLALERVAAAADPALRGPIRLTTSMALATDLLMPDLLAFQQQYPEVELHVSAGSGIQDLAQREADVAIRIMPMGSSPAEELAGRKAAVAYRAVYGSGDTWLGWVGGPKSLKSEGSAFGDLPERSSMRGIALQRSACAAGFGLAWLPCFYAEPLLERRTEPEPGGEVWVLVHPDLRKNPRLRVFRDRMVEVLRTYQPRLAGRG
ncbi:MAG: LysR family transcriptional regulator [Proteobacteria bacterium]|nr:LysR family transcriptional regulator [Pseudomonadota bacterium]